MIIIGGEVKPNLNTTTEQTVTIELIDLDTGATMEVHGDKVSGLQFSGEPTERALRYKQILEDYIKVRNHVFYNSEECYVAHHAFIYDYEEELLEALQLMAEERR